MTLFSVLTLGVLSFVGWINAQSYCGGCDGRPVFTEYVNACQISIPKYTWTRYCGYIYYRGRRYYQCFSVPVYKYEITYYCCTADLLLNGNRCYPRYPLTTSTTTTTSFPWPTSTTARNAPVTGTPTQGTTTSTRSCGRSKYFDAGAPVTLIVSGTNARPHEFPWTVSIRTGSQQSHFCGGTLIHEQYVLTAAHCAEYFRDYSIRIVTVGEHNRDETEFSQTNYWVSNIYVHPSYLRRYVNNDVAILKLTEPVRLSENVQIACLPEAGQLHEGRKSYVTGWGATTYRGPTSRILQYAELTVQRNTVCNNALRRRGVSIPISMMCGSSGSFYDKDSCQGDSGGPLAVKESDGRFTVVGIVSWGYGCAMGTPGIYMRVSEYLDFIYSIVPRN